MGAPAQPAATAYDRKIETFALPDLMGLDEAQLREKLGLAPAAHAYLSVIDRRDGAEQRMLRLKDLIFPGDNCDDPGTIVVELKDGARTSTAPMFDFVDGKLAGIRRHDFEAPADGATLTRTCAQVASLSAADRATYIVLLSPFALLATPDAIADASRRAAGQSALEVFRLGEEPPGGLATYIKRAPAAVRVGGVVNGRQVLSVAFTKASKLDPAWLVRVTVEGGRVVRIEKDKANRLTCALMPNGAMRCDMPAVRKSHYAPPT